MPLRPPANVGRELDAGMALRPGEATAAGIGFHAPVAGTCVCSTTSTVVAQPAGQHRQNPRPKEHPVHNRITLLAGTTGAVLAVAASGCGGGAAKTIPAKAAAPASGSSTPTWQPGTPTPKITAGLRASGRWLDPRQRKPRERRGGLRFGTRQRSRRSIRQDAQRPIRPLRSMHGGTDENS